MGISGRIARFFLGSALTPLMALSALLLGLFAVAVTPREEEPQIDVTMVNVLVPFPGASVADVESLVAGPAEQVLSQIRGVEHVHSMSEAGMAVLTVQFKVGVPRTEALVRLNDALDANRDWLAGNLGVGAPIIKPKGIDDVPIVSLTLTAPTAGGFDLERVAHTLEPELKRVPGTREVYTLGGPGRVVRILLDPEKMAAYGISALDVGRVLQLSNAALPSGSLVKDNRLIAIEAGNYLQSAREVSELMVGVVSGRPVFIADIARVEDGPDQPGRYVWSGYGAAHAGQKLVELPAVTLAITKKPGENAVDVATRVLQRLESLKGVVIPAEVTVQVTRNYGETANDKAQKLIQKLLFATASVVALVFVSLGRREALIVGGAVILTLAATLFASWAWGFTLNRVSLFALIFSIGILVDDAIVVVENIHRHRALYPEKSLFELIPGAVDEVGGPTILATLTVIAALLPMAFVTGLMGPYMSPIPINASLGMLISLAIAFMVSPWMAARWLPAHHAASDSEAADENRLTRLFRRVMSPFMLSEAARRNRRRLWLGMALLIVLSVGLAGLRLVVLKMLPFDNKSEFQVVLDMPAGTPVEETAAVLHELAARVAQIPEVDNYQAYAGTASPISFNGLVRQYYLRQSAELGDLQVNLVDKHHRQRSSHDIARSVRQELEAIARAHGGRAKVVEVPPGPPVLSPIVAEVYGPDEAGRNRLASDIRATFEKHPDLVAVDDSVIEPAEKWVLHVDQNKAALLGVAQKDIVDTLRIALSGADITPLLDGVSRYEVPVRLVLPPEQQSSLEPLLRLNVKSASGALVPLSELVAVQKTAQSGRRYHKDLLPMSFVLADMGGALDSPLYGLFAVRPALQSLATPSGTPLGEYFIHQPDNPYREYAIKWDGEWQVTFETFRDMGAAYAVGLLLIYLLVVAQFKSYLLPLIIMAPIPLTVIGVMPGHALLGAHFTATSMIGMIALAGIIVRNSILLVDFIQLQQAQGMALAEAVIQAAATRAKPILLTALAAMLGAFFILDDPIFNGLAIALIFGILVSTLLTLVVIPLLYFTAYAPKAPAVPSLTASSGDSHHDDQSDCA